MITLGGGRLGGKDREGDIEEREVGGSLMEWEAVVGAGALAAIVQRSLEALLSLCNGGYSFFPSSPLLVSLSLTSFRVLPHTTQNRREREWGEEW